MHRLLNGLANQQAWQQLKFVKDPGNIDDVLDKLVKYRDTHQSGNLTKEGIGQCPARAAGMTAGQTEVPFDSDHSEDKASGQVT